MKILILCSFLLLFVGFTYSQETVKLKEIGLEVMKEDLGVMTFDEAKKACADLGDEWRLPTGNELYEISELKDNICGFAHNIYWSTTGGDEDDNRWYFIFDDGSNSDNYLRPEEGVRNADGAYYVRAVRDLK